MNFDLTNDTSKNLEIFIIKTRVITCALGTHDSHPFIITLECIMKII